MHVKQLFKHWTYQVFAPGTLLRRKYEAFKSLLRHDAVALELIADLEELFYGEVLADRQRANWLAARLSRSVKTMAGQLVEMNPTKYMDLPEYFRKIDFYVRMALELEQPEVGPPYILSLEDAASLPRMAGGKAANLGRVLGVEDVPVPPGFVVTANAFNYLVDYNELGEEFDSRFRQMVAGDRDLLGGLTAELQELIMAAEVPEEISRGIRFAVSEIITGDDLIAVRSSALAEDGEISFAGSTPANSTSSPTTCWRRTSGSWRASTARAPCPTASPTASRTRTRPWPCWSSPWSTRTTRAWSTPGTRTATATTPSASTACAAWATGWWTARSPRPRPRFPARIHRPWPRTVRPTKAACPARRPCWSWGGWP